MFLLLKPWALFLSLQLLGLVGVRKALEWVFSPQELLWLDELMPEKEKSIPEKGLEPEYSFSGSDSKDVSSRMRPLRRRGQEWESTLVRELSLKSTSSVKPEDLTSRHSS